LFYAEDTLFPAGTALNQATVHGHERERRLSAPEDFSKNGVDRTDAVTSAINDRMIARHPEHSIEEDPDQRLHFPLKN
jgi:hypothetical protein